MHARNQGHGLSCHPHVAPHERGLLRTGREPCASTADAEQAKPLQALGHAQPSTMEELYEAVNAREDCVHSQRKEGRRKPEEPSPDGPRHNGTRRENARRCPRGWRKERGEDIFDALHFLPGFPSCPLLPQRRRYLSGMETACLAAVAMATAVCSAASEAEMGLNLSPIISVFK